MRNCHEKAIPHTELALMAAAIEQYADIRPAEEKEKYIKLKDKLFDQKTVLDANTWNMSYNPDTFIFTKSELEEIILAFKVFKIAVEHVEWSDRVDGVKVMLYESNEAASNMIKEFLQRKMEQVNQLEQE